MCTLRQYEEQKQSEPHLTVRFLNDALMTLTLNGLCNALSPLARHDKWINGHAHTHTHTMHHEEVTRQKNNATQLISDPVTCFTLPVQVFFNVESDCRLSSLNLE